MIRTKGAAMPRCEFSQAIIAGLRSRGLSDPDIARAAGISPQALAEIRTGNRALSAKSIRSIEESSQLTTGELAALSIEPDGGPYTDLAKSWAGFAETTSPANQPRRR
jgi:transcriptional regulator with XRE-family HTH domain